MKVDPLEAFGEGSRRQFQSMEMLRGLAALAVVLGHMTMFGTKVPTGSHMTPHPFLGNFFNCGTLGVDVFFCLSGFIITWIHAADIGFPSRAPRFLLRRFVRIYPSYLLLLLLKLVFYSWRGTGDSSVPLAERLFNSVFLIPFDMHQPDGTALIFAVAWTLSYEVFFYALFCFALILGPRFARNAALLWVTGIVLYHFSPHGSAVWRMTDFVFSPFNLEFLGGVGAGLLAQRPWGRRTAWGCLLGATLGIFGGIVGGVLSPHSGILSDQNLFQKAMWGLLIGLFLLGAARFEWTRPLSLPPSLLLLGAASYSIYLLHMDLLVLGIKIGEHALTADTATASLIRISLAGLAAVGGGIAYHLAVEKPLLRAGRRWLAPSTPPLVAERG